MEVKKRLSYFRRGRRYAICRVCSKEWNIAIGQIVDTDGYVCPKCEGKEGELRNTKDRNTEIHTDRKENELWKEKHIEIT